MHGEDNLEEKTREDADNRMCYLGLNLFNNDDGWPEIFYVFNMSDCIKYMRVGARQHRARRGQLGREDQGGPWH